MKPSALIYSPSARWIALFGLWIVLLSGVFAKSLGPPGIIQAVGLNNLLNLKKAELKLLQEEVSRLQREGNEISSNRFAQEREIRRVLGYAASDEIIFDFSNN